ncbi:MAG: hypothetical protein CMJ59_16595 [Planctomycetaceae bacterium]|nr:hypothetical protein [Planctomycetaceae bacterium]
MADSQPIDDRDWSRLSRGEQIRQVELEGYLVLPDLLSGDEVRLLQDEVARLETTPVDYSDRQRGCSSIQFRGGAITRLIAHPPALAFLRDLLGGDLIFMTYGYARSEPGHPGISLHTDGQPYGSDIFGYEGSCPWTVRVLYYLDDLTPEVSPFRVVPRSHLCMHADANPYRRFAFHPDEVMVTLKAGSAVLINHKVFHGNYPNTGTHSRGMLAISYRPAWAGPVQPVDEWPVEDVDRLPEDVRFLFQSPNHREGDFHGGNKPLNMPSMAPGMNIDRWERAT